MKYTVLSQTDFQRKYRVTKVDGLVELFIYMSDNYDRLDIDKARLSTMHTDKIIEKILSVLELHPTLVAFVLKIGFDFKIDPKYLAVKDDNFLKLYPQFTTNNLLRIVESKRGLSLESYLTRIFK